MHINVKCLAMSKCKMYGPNFFLEIFLGLGLRTHRYVNVYVGLLKGINYPIVFVWRRAERSIIGNVDMWILDIEAHHTSMSNVKM